MRWLDELLGGPKTSEGFRRLENRLDDIESLLTEHDLRTDDKFDVILSGLDTVMPKEKGHFLNQLEERLVNAKRDMVTESVLAECLEEPSSYPELKRSVKSKTGLRFSNAFLDSCIRNLTYERKLEKVGKGYIVAKAPPAEFVCPEGAKEQEEILASLEKEPVPQEPATKKAGSKLERLNTVLNLVESLERKHGSVPVDVLLEEGKRCGISESTCNQLLDEHLMITGQLYEPRQGHVKLVRTNPVLA